MKKQIILLHILCFLLLQADAQIILSPDSAVQLALEGNGHILAKQQALSARKEQVRLGTEISPTQFTWQRGQYNSYVANDNNFGINQSLPFPVTMKAKRDAYMALYGLQNAYLHLAEDELAFQVRNACASLVYLQERQRLFTEQDSLYGELEKAAKLRYSSGDGNFLDWQQALAKRADLKIALSQLNNELKNQKASLKSLIGIDWDFEINWDGTKSADLSPFAAAQNGRLQVMTADVYYAEREIKLEQSQFWPSIQVSYFNQSLIGGPVSSDINAPLAISSNRFQGFGIGLSIPLWAGPQMARVRAAKLSRESEYNALLQTRAEIETSWNNLLGSFMLAKTNLQEFETTSLPIAKTLREQAELARKQGTISTTEYLYQLNDALALLERHADLQQQIRLLSNQILLINGSN